MGFLRRLFTPAPSDTPGTKPPAPEQAAATPFVTNAPPGWPVITGSPSALTDDDFVPRITFVGAVADAVGKDQIEQMEATLLLDGGLLRVPLFVAREGRRFGLFPYPAPTPEAAAHFAGVKAAAAEEAWTPVYVSTGPLPNAEAPADVLHAGALAIAPYEGEVPDDDYAMWWPPAVPSSEGPLDKSGLDLWTRVYEALDGINSYVFAAQARQIGLIPADQPVARATFPEDLLVQPVQGPEGHVFLFSASREKGIRLHFPRTTTSDLYLTRYLNLLVRYAEGWKAGAVEQDFPLDPRTEGDEWPLRWWRILIRAVAHMEEQGELGEDAKVGILPMRGSGGAGS